MQMTFRRTVLFAALAVLAGCGDDSATSKWQTLSPGVYVAEKSVPLRDMSPDDVLYFVNGEKITKADFDERAALETAIFVLQKGDQKMPQKSKRKMLSGIRKNVPSHLVQRKLYLQAAGKSGVEPKPGEEQKKEETFLKRLPRRPKAGELEKKMGASVYAALKRSFAEDALIEAYRASYWTNSYLTVSEEAISNKWEEVQRVNAKADTMNAKMRAKALEFKQKVQEGGDFGELTLKYAKVHPEYGTNWTSAVLAEFAPEEDIYKWLSGAKDGDISDPIELDDGLAVIKLVSRHRANLPKGFTPEDEFTMVRCTFYIFNKYVEETSPESIREVFLREQLQQAHGELGVRLWNAAVIELPNGEDFFKPAPKKQADGAKASEKEKKQ